MPTNILVTATRNPMSHVTGEAGEEAMGWQTPAGKVFRDIVTYCA